MVSDTFDHTSTLKFISARYGVPVPNLTAGRDSVVGDMTSAFNFASPPNATKPNLSHPLLAAVPKLPQCVPNVVLGTSNGTLPAIPYRVPYPQAMPTQESAPAGGFPADSAVSPAATAGTLMSLLDPIIEKAEGVGNGGAIGLGFRLSA